MSLQNLTGLEGLETAISVRLINNANLTSIEGLENMNLSSAIGNHYMFILDNSLLSSCAIELVCNAIGDPEVQLVIQENDLGCNSIQEVEDDCLLFLSEFDLKEAISLFPNPVSSKLQIHTSEGIVLQKATVFSILGEELISTSEEILDFSTLSAGIYFVKVNTDRGSIIKKIVKE